MWMGLLSFVLANGQFTVSLCSTSVPFKKYFCRLFHVTVPREFEFMWQLKIGKIRNLTLVFSVLYFTFGCSYLYVSLTAIIFILCVVYIGCEDIIAEALTIENLPRVLQWSTKPFGSAWVHRQAVHFLREEFIQIAHHPVLYELGREYLVEAIGSDFLQVCFRNDVMYHLKDIICYFVSSAGNVLGKFCVQCNAIHISKVLTSEFWLSYVKQSVAWCDEINCNYVNRNRAT